MKLKILAASLLVALLLPISASAEYKIATVDINAVLNESKDAQKKKKDLDKQSADARAKIEKRKAEMEKLEKSLAAKKVKPDSPEADDFRKKARDFAKFVKDTEADLKSKFLKVNNSLTTEALKHVETYAKANKIDLVLDKSAQDARGPVLFGNPGADITKEIIKKMNS